MVPIGIHDNRAGETGFKREHSDHVDNSDPHIESHMSRVYDQSGKAGYRYMYSDRER